MTSDDEIRYDRSLLGVEHPIGSFHVTAEMISAFARATGDVAAGSGEGPVAPPTFCNLFISGATRPDIGLEFGDTGFFAGQAIESLRPVRANDVLEAKTRLKDVYAKTGRSGKMVFVVWETTFSNQNADLVALVQESFVRRNRDP